MLSIIDSIENIKNKLNMKKEPDFLKDENGKVLSFYHGTTRRYIEHKNIHRSQLNKNYQGDGFHYVKSPETAWKYAKANRNQCIDRDLFIKDLKFFLKKNNIKPNVAKGIKDLTYLLMEKGNSTSVWEEFSQKYALENNVRPEDGTVKFFKEIRDIENKYNFNINDYIDILEYVEGSNLKDFDELENIHNFLNAKTQEIPHYINEDLEKMGFYRAIVEPRIIESQISAEKILKTNNREKAKNAFKNGYDLIIYNGADCVDEEPEYIVKDLNQIKIKGYHILTRTEKEIDVACTEILETVNYVKKEEMKSIFDKIYLKNKQKKRKKLK